MQCTLFVRKPAQSQRHSSLRALLSEGASFSDMLTEAELGGTTQEEFAQLPLGKMQLNEEGELLLYDPAPNATPCSIIERHGQELFSFAPLNNLRLFRESWEQLKRDKEGTQRILSFRFLLSWGIRDVRIRMVRGQNQQCWVALSLLTKQENEMRQTQHDQIQHQHYR